MNMVGNMGAAVSAVAFPYFVENVRLPFFAEETGTANSFFVFAATINILAIVAWIFMNPRRELQRISPEALKIRLAFFAILIVSVISALVYTKFIYEDNPATPNSDAEPPPAIISNEEPVANSAEPQP